MMKGKSLAELARELDRQQKAKADYIADTRNLTLLTEKDEDGKGVASELHIKDQGEFPVNENCRGQIGLRLGMPSKFYNRLFTSHPTLLDHNVNTLFREDPEQRMVRTLDGTARAFLSDRYRRLDNFELAQAVLPVLGDMPGVEFKSCELTERRMYIKALLPQTEAEVKVGDPVCAGVVISNSEVGYGALRVSPLVYRLVCSNGMIAAKAGKAKYHVGRQIDVELDAAYEVFRDETLEADDAAFFMKVTDIVKAAADEATFTQIVMGLRELTEVKITGDPVQAVTRLGQRLRLTEGEQGGVLRHLIEGGDISQWGVLNAVTREAQDAADYDRSVEMEQMGGLIAQYTPNEFAAIAA